jgi:5-methylcytosine-specific restriction endonuclease McrA
MKAKLRQDKAWKAWLLANAKAVAAKLKLHSQGTRLRIRIPSRTLAVRTDGWSVVLGDLGKGKPRLEIWFDRITGYSDRKLYAAFYAPNRRKIISITERVSRKLLPIRTIGSDDTTENKYLFFTQRLGGSEFNVPILEKYAKGNTFFGIYDPTRPTTEKVNLHFCSRAVAFFEDVVRSLPHATAQDEHREVYPRYENRKRVISHLHRERSGYLATECKIRDNYKCQVCGLLFEERYGKLGQDFAESHHRVPLSKLKENIKTKLEDLTTVCANCHRILHKMEGKRDDIMKLRAVVRKRSAAAPRRRR